MGVLGAVGGMEAVRALPPVAQIQAVKGIAEAGNAVDRAGNAVRNWARNNPNTSEVAKAAANVGGTALGAAKSISSVKRVDNISKANGIANATTQPLLRAQLTGQEISNGHAFDKHVIQQKEFSHLGITTRQQFAKHIQNVVANPTSVKTLSNGRSAYWDGSTGTVVIRNPKASDGGNSF